MRTAPLLTALVALSLVACSAASTDSVDQLSSAVKPGTYEPPVEPTPEPETPAPLPEETCASMRAKPARSEVQWTWTGPMAGTSEKPYVDVEIHLSRRELHGDELWGLKDGTREFKITLSFSTVKNGPLYASFGGFPMDEKTLQISGRLMAHAEFPDPFTSVPSGLSGNQEFVSIGTCRDGDARGEGHDLVDEHYHDIETLKIENGIAEGKFIRKDKDKNVIAFGTFKGPIVSDEDMDDPSVTSTGQPIKKGFRNKPKRNLCCLID